MFFADLVVRTDEARRAFETHPVVLDAVANGMSLERYRTLLLELYHVVWHFNPVSAAAASRMRRRAPAGALLPLRAHAGGDRATRSGCCNDLEAVGVAPAATAAHAALGSTRWR